MNRTIKRALINALAALPQLLLGVMLPAPSSFANDGSFDTTWTGGGRITFPGDYFNSGNSSYLNILVTQSDGTLLLGGDSNGWWLGEMTAAGQFVPTFGTSDGTGRITSCALGFCGSLMYSALPQTDGRYLVVSLTELSRTTSQAHAFDTSGVSGGTGYVGNDFPINNVQGYVGPSYGVARQADGTVLLAGQGTYSLADSVTRFGVVKLNADLSLDASFNAITDGMGVTFAGGALVRVDATDLGEAAAAVLVQADGRIVLVGVGEKASNGTGYLDLARLNADGSLDKTFGFGAGGTAELQSPAVNVSYSLLTAKFDRAGRIVVAMQTQATNGAPEAGMLVARLTADGKADSSFGNSGFFYDAVGRIGLGCTYVASNDFAIDSAGRIVVAGLCDNYFLVERIRGDNGNLDTSFGYLGASYGGFAANSTADVANAVTFDAGGRLLVGGSSTISGEQYAGLGRLTYDLIFTNNFESLPRGCLPPDCN